MTGNTIPWRKSPLCDTNSCVEWAELTDQVLVRQSEEPDGPVLRFTREEWAAFVAGLVAQAQLPR